MFWDAVEERPRFERHIGQLKNTYFVQTAVNIRIELRRREKHGTACAG